MSVAEMVGRVAGSNGWEPSLDSGSHLPVSQLFHDMNIRAHFQRTVNQVQYRSDEKDFFRKRNVSREGAATCAVRKPPAQMVKQEKSSPDPKPRASNLITPTPPVAAQTVPTGTVSPTATNQEEDWVDVVHPDHWTIIDNEDV